MAMSLGKEVVVVVVEIGQGVRKGKDAGIR